jgi:hypothetical protein
LLQQFAVNVAELVSLALFIAVVVPSANAPLDSVAGASKSLVEFFAGNSEVIPSA